MTSPTIDHVFRTGDRVTRSGAVHIVGLESTATDPPYTRCGWVIGDDWRWVCGDPTRTRCIACQPRTQLPAGTTS